MQYLTLFFNGHYKRLSFAALLVVFLPSLTACVSEPAQKATTFITWESREMDTWASVWLINHYIAPETKVIIRPTGSPTQDGTAFAIADAPYKKANGRSTFESLASDFQINTPEVNTISELIRTIEVTPWASSGSSLARLVENAFRGMDKKYRPGRVPVTCYQSFFESLANTLRQADDSQSLEGITLTSVDCPETTAGSVYRDKNQHVRLLDINQILESIGKGKKVVFVDTRESSEYEETHIPGAINLKLRDINPSVKPLLEGADLVVPYCIKDFRGYEVAQALNKLGVSNVATMKPYGLAGWRSYQLPTAGAEALSETVASQRLTDCIRGKKNCYKREPG